MALHSDGPWEFGNFCIHPLALPAELENDQLRIYIADLWCGPDGRDSRIALAAFFLLVREAAKRGLEINEQISLDGMPAFQQRANHPLFKKWTERINSEKEIRNFEIDNAINFDWHGVQVIPLKKEVAAAAKKIFPGFDPDAAQKYIREWMDNYTLSIGEKDPDYSWARNARNWDSAGLKAWKKRRWNESFPQFGGNVEVD